MRVLTVGTIVSLVLVVFLTGCSALRPARTPMPTIEYATSGMEQGCLLVLLPGRRDTPGDFEGRGFIEALRESGVAADAVAADAHMGYFRAGTILDRLHEDVILPARARGYERIWLVGVSAGGTGSILYARAHPDQVAGIVLIAPFLGSNSLIAEVEGAGGPGRWQPSGSAGEPFEQDLWEWLGRVSTPDGSDFPLFLGFGESDRFAAGHRLLAASLPAEHVLVEPGGHDWRPWLRIFEGFLESGALARSGCDTTGPGS